MNGVENGKELDISGVHLVLKGGDICLEVETDRGTLSFQLPAWRGGADLAGVCRPPAVPHHSGHQNGEQTGYAPKALDALDALDGYAFERPAQDSVAPGHDVEWLLWMADGAGKSRSGDGAPSATEGLSGSAWELLKRLRSEQR
jgi:hypothetical protein